MLDKVTISNLSTMLRKKYGEDEMSPIDIFAMANSIDNLTLLFYPLGDRISGACIKSDYSGLIAINSTMSLGRQRFTLAHEFFHYFFDSTLQQKTICQKSFTSDNEKEKEANIFASYFLIPSASLFSKVYEITKNNSVPLTLQHIISLEQHFGVSRRAMLTRLVSDGYLREPFSDELITNVIINSAKLGFKTELYKASSEGNARTTLGHYIKSVERLFSEDLISYGKYEEFLMEAFRDDLLIENYESEDDNVD